MWIFYGTYDYIKYCDYAIFQAFKEDTNDRVQFVGGRATSYPWHKEAVLWQASANEDISFDQARKSIHSEAGPLDGESTAGVWPRLGIRG